MTSNNNKSLLKSHEIYMHRLLDNGALYIRTEPGLYLKEWTRVKFESHHRDKIVYDIIDDEFDGKLTTHAHLSVDYLMKVNEYEIE